MKIALNLTPLNVPTIFDMSSEPTVEQLSRMIALTKLIRQLGEASIAFELAQAQWDFCDHFAPDRLPDAQTKLADALAKRSEAATAVHWARTVLFG